MVGLAAPEARLVENGPWAISQNLVPKAGIEPARRFHGNGF
jgi:hypothetical protein